MSTRAFEEQDGVTLIRCHRCSALVARQQLGQHLRAHRAAETTPTTESPRLLPQVSTRRQRKERIKQICENRQIKKVVHFTRIENLVRILREGLLPRSTLERYARKGRRFIAVDPDRYDGHKHTISVSISFPNYLMFFKARQQTSDEKWVVLTLDFALLWELDCAFCQDNAASADVRSRTLPSLKRLQALEAMFAKTVLVKSGRVHRSDLSAPPFFPTNPQAEVLVCEPIKPRYVSEVAFFDGFARRRWIEANGNAWPGVDLTINYGFFRSRPCDWDEVTRALNQ